MTDTQQTQQPKQSRKTTVITGVVALIVGVAVGAAAGGGSDTTTAAPLPAVTKTVEVPVPGPTVTVKVPGSSPDSNSLDRVPGTTTSTSSCDDAREAFLTGSPADVEKALKALKADKSADQIAREYAGYWLGRDRGDSTLQGMDESLITSACGLS